MQRPQPWTASRLYVCEGGTGNIECEREGGGRRAGDALKCGKGGKIRPRVRDEVTSQVGNNDGWGWGSGGDCQRE